MAPHGGNPRSIQGLRTQRLDWGQSAPRVTHGSNHIHDAGEPKDALLANVCEFGVHWWRGRCPQALAETNADEAARALIATSR